MIFLGFPHGVVSQLRVCLPLRTPFFGEDESKDQAGLKVARVHLTTDPRALLGGQSKLPIPYLACSQDNTGYEGRSRGGAALQGELVEVLHVYAILDGKRDKVGHAAMDEIHKVRLDLKACLHGWNPSIAADNAVPPVDYGYCTKMFEFTGDRFYDQDAEREVWEFDFTLRSTITNQDQGFGQTNPQAINDLVHIHADFDQESLIDDDQPAIASHLHPL